MNNRVGLHRRSEVGGEVGGLSRWLLRAYGLETADLDAEQRSSGSSYKPPESLNRAAPLSGMALPGDQKR